MSEQRQGETGDSGSGQVSGYFVPLPPEREDKGLDVQKMLQDLLARKVLILICAALATILAGIFAFSISPVYRSEILLAPTSAEEEKGGLSALINQYGAIAPLSGLGSSSSSKDEALAVLRSRKFTKDFITSEGLLPLLYSDRWDSTAGDWADGSASAPTMAEAYELFDQKVRSLSEDVRRNLVTVRIEWQDPELAARWANRMVEILNEYLRVRDIAEAESSIEFLNKQLEASSVIEIRQGIYGLIENQIELIMLAKVRDEYAFKILDPAVAADPDKFDKPNRRMMIVLGFLVGLFLSSAFVVLRAGKQRQE